MKVTIIGIGGLGSALAAGLVGRAGIDLCVSDRHADKLAPFAGNARVEPDPVAAADGADVVVLAVKPAHTAALATSISAGADALVISCAAGVPTSSLPGTVARAMPSIGASLQASTTAVFLGARCVADRDRARVRAVFDPLGPVVELFDEDKLHAATALTASAPAWILLAVEALADGGVEAGLTRGDALALARGGLCAAAARLAPATEPQALRAQVTSPAGTTAAGHAALEAAGVRAGFLDAVRSAIKRSRELAGGSARA